MAMEGHAPGGRLAEGELDWFASPEFWTENEFKVEEHVGSGAGQMGDLPHPMLPDALPGGLDTAGIAPAGSTFTGLQSADSYQVRHAVLGAPRIAPRARAQALIVRSGPRRARSSATRSSRASSQATCRATSPRAASRCRGAMTSQRTPAPRRP
jgi:hypothetical protein